MILIKKIFNQLISKLKTTNPQDLSYADLWFCLLEVKDLKLAWIRQRRAHNRADVFV